MKKLAERLVSDCRSECIQWTITDISLKLDRKAENRKETNQNLR